MHVRAVRCGGAMACVGSGDHTGRLIQFLFSTELCPWITFGGQVSGHHCRSEGNKAGACVSGGCRTSSASRLEVLGDSAGELERARSRSRRRRPWASKCRDVHSLCACDDRRRPAAVLLCVRVAGSRWRECPLPSPDRRPGPVNKFISACSSASSLRRSSRFLPS